MSDKELGIPHLYDRMQGGKLPEISPEATLKLILRCRMMFDCRGQVLRIL